MTLVCALIGAAFGVLALWVAATVLVALVATGWGCAVVGAVLGGWWGWRNGADIRAALQAHPPRA